MPTYARGHEEPKNDRRLELSALMPHALFPSERDEKLSYFEWNPPFSSSHPLRT
jgi:hypothetical protein